MNNNPCRQLTIYVVSQQSPPHDNNPCISLIINFFLMHDLHVADKVIKQVLDVAEQNKLNRVREIKIELGEVIEHGDRITPENLIFNIEMLAKGGVAEGAKITIESVESDHFAVTEIEGE